MFSPQSICHGLPRKFAEKYMVDLTKGEKTVRKHFDSKIIANLEKFQQVATELKASGVNLKSRTAGIQADRVMAGKPAVDPVVEVKLADDTYTMFGNVLWPLSSDKDTPENRKVAECTLMFCYDWDVSLNPSTENAKGRGIIMGQRAKWLRGMCPVGGQVAMRYAILLQDQDKEISVRSYPETNLPNAHIVKAKYKLNGG